MLSKLPGWVVSNDDSVRAECAPYRDMPLDQVAAEIAALARAHAQLMARRPDRDEIYAWQDPLPPDSVALLRRLAMRR